MMNQEIKKRLKMHRKIIKLVERMYANLACNLEEGFPCKTCEEDFYKSLKELNEEVEDEQRH